jgi:hypothetical protein
LATGGNQSSSVAGLQKSTADNSLMTQKLGKKDENTSNSITSTTIGINWLKQIIDYKNAILGNKDSLPG